MAIADLVEKLNHQIFEWQLILDEKGEQTGCSVSLMQKEGGVNRPKQKWLLWRILCKRGKRRKDQSSKILDCFPGQKK